MKMNVVLLIVVVLVVIGGGFFYFRNQSAMNKPVEKMTATESPTQAMMENVREVSMTAKQWEFTPSEVRVKEGETVKLKVKSVDVAHGFSLPDFNVDEKLEPGKEVTVEFVANKKGMFTFFCSVLCGQGHKDMKGTLIVE